MAIITTNEVIVRRGANPLLSGLTDLLDVSLPTFLPTNIARPTLKSFASSYLIKAKEPWTFKKKPAKYILHFITLNISQFKSRTKEILREFFFCLFVSSPSQKYNGIFAYHGKGMQNFHPGPAESRPFFKLQQNFLFNSFDKI